MERKIFTRKDRRISAKLKWKNAGKEISWVDFWRKYLKKEVV